MIRPLQAGEDEHGFSLIEMIAALAIMSILIGVSTVNYDGVKRRAQISAIETILYQLIDAEELYFAEHDEYWPANRTVKRHPDDSTPLEELDFVFPTPQPYLYIIRGVDRVNRSGQRLEAFYIRIEAPFDYDGNNRPDRFQIGVLIKDGAVVLSPNMKQVR